MAAVEIIAHRGASHDAPENTLLAFRMGYEQAADACELDIHLSKDGKIIVIHDSNTGRTTGVTNRVVDQAMEQLLTLPAGRWGPWTRLRYSEKLPSLAEALALVPEGKRMFIEIKTRGEILPELGNVMESSRKKPEQLPIITFHLDTAKAAKARFPRHEISWLVGYGRDEKTGKFPEIDTLIQSAREAGLDGLDLHFDFPIDAAFTKKVHDAGLKLYVWTVDEPGVARRIAKAGVDGITTNRPEWLRRQLALHGLGR